MVGQVDAQKNERNTEKVETCPYVFIEVYGQYGIIEDCYTSGDEYCCCCAAIFICLFGKLNNADNTPDGDGYA